jgi:flagellum-specific ATP synthase
MRLKGAYTAMAIAEHFRDQGMKVMLMMDSVTRFAMAQREVGLSTGELPATKGYPPSVFAELPRLLERAGAGETGSITGLFTVLVEGDDLNDPIADHVRSILDGHIVLSRDLAIRNHYPAIDVLQSVSRLSSDLNQHDDTSWIDQARESMAEYHQHKDIITLGAYKAGTNTEIDKAISVRPALNQFLKQRQDESSHWVEDIHSLKRIMSQTTSPMNPEKLAV